MAAHGSNQNVYLATDRGMHVIIKKQEQTKIKSYLTLNPLSNNIN